MKSFKIQDDEWFCFAEDAIFHENDFYSPIRGDYTNGFSVESPRKIKNITDDDWTCLDPTLEIQNEKYHIFSGETSWGGAGFVAVKDLETNSFKWVLHSYKMNNPIRIQLENHTIRLTTDLDYPNGVDFVIPIENPKDFQVEKSTKRGRL